MASTAFPGDFVDVLELRLEFARALRSALVSRRRRRAPPAARPPARARRRVESRPDRASISLLHRLAQEEADREFSREYSSAALVQRAVRGWRVRMHLEEHA